MNKLQHENKLLNERVENYILTFRQKEKIINLNESSFKSEIQNLKNEKKMLEGNIKNNLNLIQQNEILENNIKNLLKINEVLKAENEILLEKFHESELNVKKNEIYYQNLTIESNNLKSEIQNLSNANEEFKVGLNKSLHLLKDFKQQLKFEKEKNEELEKKLMSEQIRLNEILKAKEQISNVMLDALQREKSIQSSITKSYYLNSNDPNNMLTQSQSQYGNNSGLRYPGPSSSSTNTSPTSYQSSSHLPSHLYSQQQQQQPFYDDDSPSKTPVARTPIESTSLHHDINNTNNKSISSTPSSSIHRSTIVLPDSIDRSMISTTTSYPTNNFRKDMENNRSAVPHDIFLTQLLSPSTPAPNVPPPLPVASSNHNSLSNTQLSNGNQLQSSHTTNPRESIFNDLQR